MFKNGFFYLEKRQIYEKIEKKQKINKDEIITIV